MRRLIEFLVGNGNLFFWLALQAIGVLLLFRSSKSHDLVYQQAAGAATYRVNEWYAEWRAYFNLGTQNEVLMSENASLRQQLINRERQLGAMEHRLPFAPNFTVLPDSLLPYQRYQFISTRVVQRHSHTDYNYIVLDKGRRDGVEKEMGLMSPTGVAGLVVDVSENYSVAMSLLNKDFKLSVRVRRPEVFGTLQWDGGSASHADLLYVPMHNLIKPGDTIATSSHGSIFPEGIIVGFVEEVKPDAQGSFHDIRVRLSTDFHQLDYLYLVRNTRKREIDSLSRPLVNRPLPTAPAPTATPPRP